MTVTLQILFNQFINEQTVSARLRPKTIIGYKTSFNLFTLLIPEANLGFTEIDKGDIINFFDLIEKRHRVVGRDTIKIGVKASTINTHRAKLGKFFEWLKINRYINTNPVYETAAPLVEYEDKKFLRQKDIDKILGTIALHSQNNFLRVRNLAIFFILLNCGVRKNELLNIRIEDVNIENKELLIRGITSKSKHNRIIPLNQEVILRIKDYVSVLKKTTYNGSYLFASNNLKNHLSNEGLIHLVKLINTKSGVNFHAHLMRHTFAVNLIATGCDVSKLKQLMGHQDIRMTAAYLRCLPSKIMRADIEKIDSQNLV